MPGWRFWLRRESRMFRWVCIGLAAMWEWRQPWHTHTFELERECASTLRLGRMATRDWRNDALASLGAALEVSGFGAGDCVFAS